MIIITGATGHVGSALAAELHEQQVAHRALVRDPAAARSKLGPDAELVQGNFDDPASLTQAFDGAAAVFLLTPPSPRQVEQELAVLQAATAAGVEHVVKLSILGADSRSSAAFRAWHGQVEDQAWRLDVALTVLRPAFYAQSALSLAAPDGTIYAPAGDGRVAFVDIVDVAQVAARALTDERLRGAALTLTGPQALDFSEVADALASATGRPHQYAAVPPQAALQAMTGQGLPSWYAEANVALLDLVAQGQLDLVSKDVSTVLGRPATLFAQVAGRTATPAASGA